MILSVCWIATNMCFVCCVPWKWVQCAKFTKKSCPKHPHPHYHYLPSPLCLYCPRWTQQMNEKHSTLWHFFPHLSPLSSSTSAQLSSVCFICESVRLAVLPRHSWPPSPRPPPLFSSMSRPPSQDKSDLRSSVIQNTDTIWSAAQSEYTQSLPWKLKIFPY